jgi:hypothetical protein
MHAGRANKDGDEEENPPEEGESLFHISMPRNR